MFMNYVIPISIHGDLYNSIWATHWDNCLNGYQKYQNLMLDGFYSIRTLIDGCHSAAIIDCA